MAATASDDAWIVDKLKIRVQLKEGKILLVEIIDQQSKEVWTTKEIDEQGASKIMEGLWEDPVITLAGMIKDGINEASGVKYSISFKNEREVVDLSLSISFYKQTRKFVVILNKKEVDAVWRLEQIIGDLRGELASKGPTHVQLYANAMGPFDNPEANFEVAKIDNLPAGKWMVELTFGVSFRSWTARTGWVHYYLFFGTTPLNNGGFYVGQAINDHTYFVPIHERYVVDSTGNQSLYFRGKPYPTQPIYRNIVVTATKLH